MESWDFDGFLVVEFPTGKFGGMGNFCCWNFEGTSVKNDGNVGISTDFCMEHLWKPGGIRWKIEGNPGFLVILVIPVGNRWG